MQTVTVASRSAAPCQAGDRWPSQRREDERAPIPPHVRRAVFERDDYRCCFCGTQTTDLHLDHIIPWSAGGGDSSDNLRALCSGCNLEKMNRYYPEDLRRELPITGTCLECAPGMHAGASTLAYCKACGCTSYSAAVDVGRGSYRTGPAEWEPGWRLMTYDPASQTGSDYPAPSWRSIRSLVEGRFISCAVCRRISPAASTLMRIALKHRGTTPTFRCRDCQSRQCR